MKKQLFIGLLVTFFLVGLGRVFIFAQGSSGTSATTESQGPPATTEPEGTLTLTEPEVQWLWGEVVSVDILNKQMIIRYLDYETDTEKEISVGVDDKTTYENIKSLEEIKPQDAVSVDYIVNTDGKNIAKNINLEKNEGTGVLPEEIKEEPKATPGLE
jgi:hypothetical protein